MNIEKVDARKLSREELCEKRQQVIRLHDEGVPVKQIIERTGLGWAAVNAAINKYLAEGASALMPAARGRKPGTGRALTPEQEAEIRQFIRMRRPLFYGLKKSLWDRETVKQLIKQKYGVDLSERVIGNYLTRWGLAPKSSKLSSKEIRQWLERNYAEVAQKAQEEGAEINWLRKPARLDADAWAQSRVSREAEAEPPVVTKKKLSMVSVATNQGKLRWAILAGAFNTAFQIKFMKALVHDVGKKKVFLIRSDLKIYNSSDFIRWINANSDSIKIFP